MQVSLEKVKSFRKQTKTWPVYQTFLIPQWYLHQKNKVIKFSFRLPYNTFNLDKVLNKKNIYM